MGVQAGFATIEGMSAAQETPARGIGTDVAAWRTLEPGRAFERMYRKHAPEVYRYALAIVHDAADAEDVTQATFLNAFRALQRGDRPQKAKSWLLAIAHNVCLQRFRTASRRPQQVAFDEDLAEAAVPDEAPSANDLVRALQQLSFNQGSALVMGRARGPFLCRDRRHPEPAAQVPWRRSSSAPPRALREQLEASVTCQEAEELLSRQLDGRLPRGERGLSARTCVPARSAHTSPAASARSARLGRRSRSSRSQARSARSSAGAARRLPVESPRRLRPSASSVCSSREAPMRASVFLSRRSRRSPQSWPPLSARLPWPGRAPPPRAAGPRHLPRPIRARRSVGRSSTGRPPGLRRLMGGPHSFPRAGPRL